MTRRGISLTRELAALNQGKVEDSEAIALLVCWLAQSTPLAGWLVVWLACWVTGQAA